MAEIKDELNHEDVGNTLGEEPSVLLFVASSFGHALECQLLTSVNDEMGSIDTSKYSEASENEDSSDIAEAIDKGTCIDSYPPLVLTRCGSD